MQWFDVRAAVRHPLGGLGVVAFAFAMVTTALAPLQAEPRLLAIALVYLLFTLIASAVWGYVVGLVAAVAADLLVNFFFVPPLHRLTVQRPENVIALVIFLAVALVGASMLARLRRQVLLAEARRAEMGLVLNLTQQVAHAVSPQQGMEQLCSAVCRAVGARGCSILTHGDDWAVAAGTGAVTLSKDDQAMASEALRSHQPVRFGAAAVARTPRSRRRVTASLTFVPFGAATRVPGVLRLAGPLRAPGSADLARLLEAAADEAATATERAQLAREAGRAEALHRADEMKTVILSSVSHDLRSPLTAIKAAIGTIRDPEAGWTAADPEGLLATVESQTDRLSATVDGLLQMSRLEGGNVEPRLEAIELAALFDDCRQAAEGVLNGHALVAEAAAGAWFRGDYALVMQALMNLLENAGKYATDGPITVSGVSDGRFVCISIADAGPGIAAADLPHVFEKFYRGSAASRLPGSGLGLAIAEAMVRISGGTIDVRSSAGGTTFTLTFPATEAPGR